MRDPVGAPASWLARAIRDGRLSSEEVVRAHLEHIGAVNPRLNAIVWVTNESAIRQAKAADRHLAKRGFEPPPLHGVPFTAKDNFDTAGVATTGGLMDPRSQVGPMARFVNDLALVLPILVGPDGMDSAVIPMPPRRRRPKLHGLKVAWYADDGMVSPSKPTVAALQAAVHALAGAGCRVTEARPQGLVEAREVTRGYWGRVRMTHERLINAWDQFRTQLLSFMQSYDLIITPVAADAAPLYRA